MIDVLIYGAGFLGTLYPVAHVVAQYDVPAGNDPDPDAWVIGWIVGLICAVLWPLVFVALVLFMVSRGLWTGHWGLPFALPSRRRPDLDEDTGDETDEDEGAPGPL